ncbi:ribulose-phosphate 3-epimerase [Fimbriimonas ginsengisoli]|uniref:Ribulose-phosphate 3-epimerase n=1 Tax=Fimbriimonas ginsengisoli Gsoil 348 TaxID=661478 RepID=A0A068NSN3_FIMGI|nr:ribulose-phosphate 3-epimerase [Fimbriimonas ginsengisoli]AIE85785.1 ribulose-phosphate 3-epimerase [Fimbriimonas ginsengisoli Gsoil 348]
MKHSLAPSILSFDLTNLHESVRTFLAAGAGIVHLDVMDGQFVPPITFGDSYVRALRSIVPQAFFEAHLMTLSPERHFEAFAEAGCGRILFHAEAGVHSYRHCQTLQSMGVEAGIAINPGTPVESVVELLDVVSLVLVMTVNPGWGGQSFISSALEKVRRIRELRPELNIEVDGGIDPKTLPIAQAAGANVFVVGSYLAKAPDLTAAVRGLMEQMG